MHFIHQTEPSLEKSVGDKQSADLSIMLVSIYMYRFDGLPLGILLFILLTLVAIIFKVFFMVYSFSLLIKYIRWTVNHIFRVVQKNNRQSVVQKDSCEKLLLYLYTHQLVQV